MTACDVWLLLLSSLNCSEVHIMSKAREELIGLGFQSNCSPTALHRLRCRDSPHLLHYLHRLRVISESCSSTAAPHPLLASCPIHCQALLIFTAAMFDASGQYVGLCKRRGRSSTSPTLPPPPPPPPAPSPAIATDLHSSLLPFLSLSSSTCPPTFSAWLSLPHALLTRHLRNTREVALLQRIASSASQLNELIARLYEAIVEGESFEHVQRHLPHRCPSLPDPPPSTLSSDSSESSSSSSSSDSSVSAAAEQTAALNALSASLAPFFECTFPAAHKPSFSSALSSSVGRHVRSISGVFVELTAVLLELQSALSELVNFQQINGRLSEELQLEGCEALAATKAAVAELEGNLVDRITALLSAQLTYQRQQQVEAVQLYPSAVESTVTGDAAAGTAQPQSMALSAAALAAVVNSDHVSVEVQVRPSQPLPPDSPAPSVASSASSSASSSSSTSSSSLSPNTRLDVILGLQPAATTKRKAHTALETHHSLPLPPPEHTLMEEKDCEHSQPAAKRTRTEQGAQGDTVQHQSSVNGNSIDQGNATAPASMRVLFASEAVGTDGGATGAQASVLDSPPVSYTHLTLPTIRLV